MKKVFIILLMLFALSGCYMAPMALLGPASSGFTTTSILQSAATNTANHLIEKSTGKTINQHVIEALKNDDTFKSALKN